MQKFQEQNKHETNSKNKNHHATRSVNKIGFTGRKIIVQVSQKEKSVRKKKSMKKISFTRRKPMYKFHEEKNQPARSFTNKIQHATIYMNKINM